MKASRQFQKQSASSATPISQTSKRLQTRPFRDPNAPTPAQPSQSSLPSDYDPSARPAWWDRLTFNPQRPSTVQAKLTVGAPNDVYEQEADRVADQVMSMPDAATQQPLQRETLPEEELQTKPLAAGITPLVQREAMPEEEPVQAKASGNADIQREAMPEEEEVQAKPLASGTLQREAMAPEEEDLQTKSLGTADLQREALPEEEDALQTKSLGTANLQREALPEEDSLQTKPSPTPDSPLPTPSLESQLSNTQGSGSPLPNDVRSFMEPRFGADFSQVRVHTGSEAVQMNRDLNAQAFTHKQDVYFGAGKIPAKDALTAHELTHVVQQSGKIHTYFAAQGNLVQCGDTPSKQTESQVKDMSEVITDYSPGSTQDERDEGSYYEKIAPAIIRVAAERKIKFQQALYILAQARTEQGRKDPVKNRYRILNMQVPLKEAEAAGATLRTRDGKQFEWLRSREEKPNGESWYPKSPFYVYGSLEEQMNHYLDAVLAGKYSSQGAGKILLQEKMGDVKEFGKALQKVGYATAHNYVSEIDKSYRMVVQSFSKILDKSKKQAEVALGKTDAILQASRESLSSWSAKLETEKQKFGEGSEEAKVAQTFVDYYNIRVLQLQEDMSKLQKDIESIQSELMQLKNLIEGFK